MNRAAIALVLVLSATAAANPVPMVTPPAGWRADAEQAASLGTKVAALKHFGGAKATVAAEAYVPPAPGVAMFVTRVTTDQLVGTREQAARAAIDDLHASAVSWYDWREVPASPAHAIIARGEWADTQTGTQSVGTVLIAASATQLVAVRGECFSADKADGAARNACVQALFTLDPGIPVADRIAFEAAPAGTATPTAPVLSNEPARLTDGQNVHLSPMTISQSKPEADRRPVYLGAGIVVLAGIFWWNRRRRERFEREDATGTSAKADPVAETDDDADDLAAAARGDAKDEP